MNAYFWLLFAVFFIGMPGFSYAQPTYAPNESDANGQKTGYWVNKDSEGRIVSRGNYVEGRRDGDWRFYISPISRISKGQEPDVVGFYTNGVKSGEWQYTESRSKVILKGSFLDDQMSGRWTFYDQKGNRLAEGGFNNGVREGLWGFYRGKQIMSAGTYSNGQKTGIWQSNYYTEDSSTHIVGAYDYSNGSKNGRFEHYKVVRHKKFPTTEVLVGTGTYLNGKKTGRWIEYSGGLRGEKVETGVYDGSGTRTALWDITIDGKKSEEISYANGKKQGSYTAYHDNGNPRYVSSYERGREQGFFTLYYPSKIMKERGAYTLLEKSGEADTIFKKILLPYEFAFRLVDIEFENYNYNAIEWIEDIDYSADGNELIRRYEDFLTYGQGKSLQVDKIVRTDLQTVRVGDYKSYYENGKVKLEGKYLPEIYTTRIGDMNYTDYARDGEWIEYDDFGNPLRIFTYDKGELKKVTDGNKNELPLEQNRLK